MATVIDFNPAKAESLQPTPSQRTYNLEITTYPDDYLEFCANGVKTDPRSLYRLAEELRRIASIICSDVITMDADAIPS